MHDIEPYYLWRDRYIASSDERSPFYGRKYSEFEFSQSIYNYFIHPQWDHFGSNTLYTKLLYADYDQGYAILEFLGEWNDCITNDIMILKRQLLEPLMEQGICRYIFVGEQILTFHSSDECYYEELKEDLNEMGGWVCMINVLEHVHREFSSAGIDQYIYMSEEFDAIPWRKLLLPDHLFQLLEHKITKAPKYLW